MRILLIGGGGVVGTALAMRMRDRHEVTILDVRHVTLPGVSSVVGDANEHESLEDLVPAADAVVHLAAIVPRGAEAARQIDAAVRLNVGSVIQALTLSVRERVPSFVHISSLSVFQEFGRHPIRAGAVPDAIAPYGLSKRLAEQACAALAAEPTTVTSLRLAFPAQAGDWPRWRSPSAPEVSGPRTLRLADRTPYPALHPDDLTDAVERTLTRRGEYAAIALAADPRTIDDDTALRLLGWSAQTGRGSVDCVR
ncbi:NAD-dependent epimerase/dehydratase family protein [Ruania alba]|uniref:UDP-glucose 4-epimerase n=1 Tax=Ruania alba TaxID=648782 RepID=A0A1H5NBZ2_9MICO|nr:NAD(P)-dependent oxidoreductase [Ruania alba]SEE99103.1 Nucleoside-diphosphate-sugar epimerase [Ruania alba]